MRKMSIFTILIMAWLMGGMTLAQPEPGPGGPGGPEGPGGGPHWQDRDFDKMQSRFENLRLIKLLEVLDMTDEQSQKMMPLIYSFQKDSKALRDERRAMVDTLSDYIEKRAPEDKVRGALDRIEKNSEQMDQRMKKFIDEAGNILDIYQTASLVIFHERFEREILKSLREFRGHGKNFDPKQINPQKDNEG